MSKRHPLPANVKRLGVVSLFNDMSSEMIFPLLPAFLVQIGAGAFALGIIEGVSDTCSSLLKLLIGKWSDRLKARRRFVVIGYGIAMLLRPLIGLVSHWPMILALRFGDRIGKGTRTSPRDALIAESIDHHHTGAAFGFHRAMDHTGALIGALIGALFIFLFPGQYRAIFLLAFIPGVIGFVILQKVRDIPSVLALAPKPAPSDLRAPIPKHTRAFLALIFLFNLAGATDAFLLLRLKENGIPDAAIPLLWAGLHVVKAGAVFIFGRVSDHLDRRILLVIGWTLYAATYFLLSLPLSSTALIGIFLVYGLFYGLTEAPERALIADWTPAESRGRVYGWYYALSGLALLPASLFFGWLWDHWTMATAFRFGAAISFFSVLSAIAVFAVFRLNKIDQDQPI